MEYVIFAVIVVAVIVATVWALRKWYPKNSAVVEGIAVGFELLGAFLSILS